MASHVPGSRRLAPRAAHRPSSMAMSPRMTGARGSSGRELADTGDYSDEGAATPTVVHKFRLRSGYIPAILNVPEYRTGGVPHPLYGSIDTIEEKMSLPIGPGDSRPPHLGRAPEARVAKDEAAIKNAATRKRNEKERLRIVFARIDTKGDGVLDEAEVAAYLRLLGYPAKPPEVAKLIWEIDDDADGVICWPEFEKAHTRLVGLDYRNESMRAAYEPRGFFNLIEFSLLDHNGDGDVSSSEVLNVFYRRYGKQSALEKLQSLADDGCIDKPVSFSDFLLHENSIRKPSRARRHASRLK